jgi:ABC-type Mn2+/Zn2+ transport system permease subunit
LLAGMLIHWISHRRWVGADAAIGVVTTSSFALGVAVISTYPNFTRNIASALSATFSASPITTSGPSRWFRSPSSRR